MSSDRVDAKLIKVEPAMTNIIEGIAEISQLVALPSNLSGSALERWSDAGFLVSGYDAEKYVSLAKREHFYAALENGKPVSFLVGYAADEDVDPADLGSVFIRNTFGPTTVIVKQIATHPDYRGHGYAQMLYQYFERKVQTVVYAAIVKVPPNISSEAFHAALGYVECATYAHPDGKPRGIWRKLYQPRIH